MTRWIIYSGNVSYSIRFQSFSEHYMTCFVFMISVINTKKTKELEEKESGMLILNLIFKCWPLFDIVNDDRFVCTVD